jgi:hypothetical protein
MVAPTRRGGLMLGEQGALRSELDDLGIGIAGRRPALHVGGGGPGQHLARASDLPGRSLGQLIETGDAQERPDPRTSAGNPADAQAHRSWNVPVSR